MPDFAQTLVSHGGLVLFAFVLVEQGGAPLPAAPWLLAAGALSASGNLNPFLAVGLTALACVMADAVWFYAGRRGGQRVLRLFCRWSLAPGACVGRTRGVFDRYGFQGLVAAKFLPGLGAVMPPLAGALGMRFGRFLIFDGVGSLIYGSVYIGAGFLFHNQLQQVLASLNHLGFSLLVVFLAFIPAYIGFRYVQRRSASFGRRNPEPEQQNSPALKAAPAAVLYERIQATEKGSKMKFSDLSRSFVGPQPVPPSAHSPTTI